MEAPPAEPVSWTVPAPERELRRLRRWREGVGPVRFHVAGNLAGRPAPPALGPVTVVAWNMRVGGGSFAALWHRLDDLGLTTGPLILLLQEVFSDEMVPPLSKAASWAARIHESPPAEARQPITSIARAHALSLLYAPSMRNGGPDGRSSEDRGNAILANVPLRSPCAIELPFERQRRVAVTAQVTVGSAAWTVCSLHLENRAPWRRAWRTFGSGRRRQMVALLDALASRTGQTAGGSLPLVLGGDFNTWVGGRREPAYALARRVLPEPSAPDPRPTHHFEIGRWLRPSDHLLFRLPADWRASTRRLDETFGSDHYPLVGAATPSGSPRHRPSSL